MQDPDNPYEDYEEESLFSQDDLESDLGPDEQTEDAFDDDAFDDDAFDDDPFEEDNLEHHDYDSIPDTEEDEDEEEDYSLNDNGSDDSHQEQPAFEPSFYDLDSPIPKTTIYNLSKSRFNELNLELVMNNIPIINTLSNDDVHNIMVASLGNSKKHSTNNSSKLSAIFSTLLSSQNLQAPTTELPIVFKERFFSDIDSIDINATGLKNFSDIIELHQITNGTYTYKACCCTQDFCIPATLIPLDTSHNIKKVFAFELLREELTERADIQRSLTRTINEYETILLDLYNKITSIKALKSKSIEDDILSLKIGIMHMAIEAEGYEDLFLHKIINEGQIKKIDDIKSLKKAVLAYEKKSPKKITTRSKSSSTFFDSNENSEFMVNSSTVDQFEKDIKARKAQLETLMSKPKPYF